MLSLPIVDTSSDVTVVMASSIVKGMNGLSLLILFVVLRCLYGFFLLVPMVVLIYRWFFS